MRRARSGSSTGGYESSELSAGSPVAEVASFPRDLVFVGRSTVLIRGLSARLGVRWSLAKEWEAPARRALAVGVDAVLTSPPDEGMLARLRAWLTSVKASFQRLLLSVVLRMATAITALRQAPVLVNGRLQNKKTAAGSSSSSSTIVAAQV